MANVNIKFNGKEFLLSCDDGQEEHLEELSIYLNQKFDDFKKREVEESKKEEQFSEKIDELNQETDNLMQEIDKWQM